MDSTIEFTIKYYDGDGSPVKAKLLFHEVVASDFEVNLFDNSISAEFFGFYEIFQAEMMPKSRPISVGNRTGFWLYAPKPSADS
jgi:hypothetical protein